MTNQSASAVQAQLEQLLPISEKGGVLMVKSQPEGFTDMWYANWVAGHEGSLALVFGCWLSGYPCVDISIRAMTANELHGEVGKLKVDAWQVVRDDITSINAGED